MEERLQKYLANKGVASRRKSEEYIVQGKVKVNDKVVVELGTKINPEKDIVEFNGSIVKNEIDGIQGKESKHKADSGHFRN